MNELFLFVRPPRPVWPFNGRTSAFWPPLAFASMAAMLRQHTTDLRVAILDAPVLKMGWRSLENELLRRRPDFVAIGEEAVSCVEGLRLARLAKAIGARVVAGGCFFGQVARQALATGLIDVIAHGEGEWTVVDLLAAWRAGTTEALGEVAGISFLREGMCVTTPPRPLIGNLDELPMPAWDLLPMQRYGAESRNHPHLVSIEASRGCFGSCDFCVLWRQMGRFVGGRTTPLLRRKSVDRLVEEVRVLTQKHGCQHLGWVDPTFNSDPHVPAQLGERLLSGGLRVGQSAWIRADCVVRDAASGALDTCIKAGLSEIYIGVERPNAAGLCAVGKTSTLDQAREAFSVFARHYPQVFTIGSFIYGLPGDTPHTVRAIHRLSLDLEMDMAFFIPLTPLPGTPFWKSDMWDPSGEAFRSFDFLPC